MDDAAAWSERVEDARKRHRPRCKDWKKDKFAWSRKFEALGDDEFLERNGEKIKRIHVTKISVDEFEERYERRREPIIIKGIPEYEDWPSRNWRPENIPEELLNLKLKCGEDEDGKSIRLSLNDFCNYLKADCEGDDSPLYVFDSRFVDTDWGQALRRGQPGPPRIFRHDLFNLVSEKRRPPYRWFLIGPARSGTNCHIDPLGTSAWNTSLVGRKRWVLFEPGTSRHVAKGSKLYDWRIQNDEPINYFLQILPRIRQAYSNTRHIEFIQYPGETVFIPAGWFHAVINLDHTLAYTQNFVSPAVFDDAWIQCRDSRPKMTCKWFQALTTAFPHLATRALALGPGSTNDKLIALFKQHNTSIPLSVLKVKEKKEKDPPSHAIQIANNSASSADDENYCRRNDDNNLDNNKNKKNKKKKKKRKIAKRPRTDDPPSFFSQKCPARKRQRHEVSA